MTNSPRKILIVDDEASIRDSLRLLLRGNFEVNTAQDGLEALAIIDDFKPDLILLDVIMPKLDGLETLRQIRERDIDIPVIMLTTSSSQKDIDMAYDNGASGFITKPSDVNEFLTSVTSVVNFWISKIKNTGNQ